MKPLYFIKNEFLIFYSTHCCIHTIHEYGGPASVFLCTHCINPWTTGASVTPDWINICNFVVRLLLCYMLYCTIYCDCRFVTYMRPCAICIHYANSEPRGLEVCSF